MSLCVSSHSTLVHEDIFLPREQGGMCERLMRMLFSW